MTRLDILFWICVSFSTVLWPQSSSEPIELAKERQEIFFETLISMNLSKAEDIVKTLSVTQKVHANNLIRAIRGEDFSFEVFDSNYQKEKNVLQKLSEAYANNIEGKENTVKVFQGFSEAISKADTLNQFNALKFSLISMLNLLRKQAFFGDEKFIPYLNHYKEIASGANDERQILLFSIGLSSNENEEMKSKFQGFEVIDKLDELFSVLDDTNPLKARYFFETAVQYKLVKDFEQAMYLMRRANFHSQKQPMNRDIYESSTWHIATLHLLNKNLDSAYFYWNKSAGLSKRLRNNWYNERLASWIHQDMREMDSAYYYLDKSIRTEIKLDGKQQRVQSSLLAIENQTEKLKLDKLQLDNRRKTNQNYLIIALSLLVIGTITAAFLQQNTTKKRKLAEQEAFIEQQKVETLLKEQELVSLDAMIAGQEKERTKVANELHDDLGSLMATVKLHFDNVKVDQKDPAMKNAQDLLEKAYQKIRGMAHAKNSGVMAKQGLLPAVQKMARTINETNAIEITVEDFGLVDRMENSLELTIFRIIQELVANIIKHAGATKATIQFTQHEDNINIIVEDNGKGFDMSAAKRSSSGMGLGTIEKRIEHLEGSFTVDSIQGKGTSILIDIPV